MKVKKQNLIVTCALPYANGSLHLGHILEQVQADIWVRLQRSLGHKCYFICADDAHGAPIMLKARELGISPKELIRNVQREHIADYLGFNISFDCYYTTDSFENQQLLYKIFTQLQKSQAIEIKEIEQLFDPLEQIFLPDRFVKGTCPKCKSPDQYGDACEICGSTYNANELIEPYSVLTHTKPILKSSSHYFFKLSNCSEFLSSWLQTAKLSQTSKNKLGEWLKSGSLQDWDISRDQPYFGFPIPGEESKFFYVWLDAPLGYLSTLLHYCKIIKEDFENLLNSDATKLCHFLGKDILYFHGLFWPAVLHKANWKLPDELFVHGFLTVDGAKMSKSKGTFIKARDFLDLKLQPDFFRYYLACKLNGTIEDIDFQKEDFVQKVNSELVGKLANLPSRIAKLIQVHFDNELEFSNLSQENEALILRKNFQLAKNDILNFYLELNYSKAIKRIIALMDEVNLYLDRKKPWLMAKNLPSASQELSEVCQTTIIAIIWLGTYLKPVLPDLVGKLEKFLQLNLSWELDPTPCSKHAFQPYYHIAERIHLDQLNFNTNKSDKNMLPVQDNKPRISIDEFTKVDLRVGLILEAKEVVGSDKLLELLVDIGQENRKIFSGIKSGYSPETLVGKKVVVVVNLQPRKMRFGESDGMVLAASGAEEEILILEAPLAKVGSPIK